MVRELCPAGTLREHDQGSAREDGLRKSESEKMEHERGSFRAEYRILARYGTKICVYTFLCIFCVIFV